MSRAMLGCIYAVYASVYTQVSAVPCFGLEIRSQRLESFFLRAGTFFKNWYGDP